jgi:hypothetical protein
MVMKVLTLKGQLIPGHSSQEDFQRLVEDHAGGGGIDTVMA